MIKIYGMPSCPDCVYVEHQVEGNSNYEIIDIGSHVRLLKEFLRLRDSSTAFDGARKAGAAGIPCFVLEDGRITLIPEEAGLHSRPQGTTDSGKTEAGTGATDTAAQAGASCSLDGRGC